jgi:hypothetical protein
LSQEAHSPSSAPAQTRTDVQLPPFAVPGANSGMKAYIDPQTGAFLSEPPPGTPPLQLSPDAFSTSDQGLVGTPLPGGGVKVDLQGRFRSPLTATVGPDGKVTITHQRPAAPPGDKK